MDVSDADDDLDFDDFDGEDDFEDHPSDRGVGHNGYDGPIMGIYKMGISCRISCEYVTNLILIFEYFFGMSDLWGF